MTIYARIAGTGSYVPEKVLTNADMEKMVDTTDQWITERTGIKERHIVAHHETASSMAEAAARRALEMANVDAASIELIIVATCTPDRLFPSAACALQQRLGITNHCPAFDIGAACSGFSYALATANNFIKTGSVKRALVIGTEVMSRIVNWEDRATCVLF